MRPTFGPALPLEPELAADAAEPARKQLLRVHAELVEQARMLLRVDLLRQLLIGLLRLALTEPLADQVENLLLGDLHDVLLRLLWKKRCRSRRGLTRVGALRRSASRACRV